MSDQDLFEQRLNEAIPIERKIAWLFYMFGCAVEPDNKDGSRDFSVRINERWERIEVKCEDRYFDSGNVCIETFQGISKRKASGIMTSESTFCVHTLKENSVVYRTQAMRLWLALNKDKLEPHEKLFQGADNGNGGYILPIERMRTKNWFEHLLTMDIPSSKLFGEVHV